MRIVRLLPLAAVLGLVSLSPAPASAERVQTREAVSDGEQQFRDYYQKLGAKDYRGALKIASNLDVPNVKEARAVQMAMRAGALMGLKKQREARDLFAEASRLAPDEGFINTLQFESALMTDHTDDAISAFDTMIVRFPEMVREMNERTVWYVIRKAPKEKKKENDDREVALARLGYGGANGDHLAQSAVRILLERGDMAGATQLLPNVDDPQVVEDMLIQRRYSKLWPALEAMAGPGLERVRLSSVAAAERAYESNPKDTDKLHRLVSARQNAGQLDRAIALRSELPANADAMAKADEMVGWSVNNVALALHEAGRKDEADALFAMLNTARLNDTGWRVSMIINRLELLVSDGKFAKAMELLPITESTTKATGNDYANQLVRRLKYCTLSGLGRKDEAAKLLPDVLAHAKDAYQATIDGLLCAGELDEAEKLVLTALKDDGFEGGFVRAMQPAALTSSDPSVWDGRWSELRKRPAIAKEFDRLGRDMPSAYLPPKPAA